MWVRVLGSAAGGGFPQWNCGCDNCRGVREGTLRATPRTQETVAVSADGERWLLLNVSPEIRAQVEAFSSLWPRHRRHTPIAGIALTNGDLDHCLGLFSLRESQPLALYATAAVRRGLTEGNVLYRTLERFPGQVTWHDLILRERLQLDFGLAVTPIPVPGKRPLHLEGPEDGASSPASGARRERGDPEDNLGLLIEDGHSRIAYFPGVGRLDDALRGALAGAAVTFFDGTFWSSDELIRQGLGTRGAEAMAHWPVGGPDGSLELLATLPGRRILIHLNNTNPLLREDSPERRQAEAAGVEVAWDGMELRL